MSSIRLPKDKMIPLADDAGERIANGMRRMGINIKVRDRDWANLSQNIGVVSISDYNQDSLWTLVHGNNS